MSFFEVFNVGSEFVVHCLGVSFPQRSKEVTTFLASCSQLSYFDMDPLIQLHDVVTFSWELGVQLHELLLDMRCCGTGVHMCQSYYLLEEAGTGWVTGFFQSSKSFWSCTHVNSCSKITLHINLHILLMFLFKA